MKFNNEEVIKIFKLRKSTNNWYESQESCPYCSKRNKIYIIFNDQTVSSFSCKHCLNKGSLDVLLKFIGREDLITYNKTFLPTSTIENVFKEKEKEIWNLEKILLPLPLQNKPLGFRRIFTNEYLEGRGFIKQHFEVLEIGETKIDPFVKNDYVIFIINDKQQRCIGWLGRSTKEKKLIDLYNKTALIPHLRWSNCIGAEFSKILGGENEIIIGLTKTTIIVEGFTSKCNLDKILKLYNSPEIKCVCSFGKKLSQEQIEILKYNQIQNIILLFDVDAIEQSKQFAFELAQEFNTKIGFVSFKHEDGSFKDPGDLNEDEVLQVLETLEDPLNFFINKTSIINFK